MTPSELPAAFHDYVAKSVGADGWPLAPGWILNQQGELTVLAMDLQCWCPISSEWCHADILLGLANVRDRQ